jgi:hypothetical protein
MDEKPADDRPSLIFEASLILGSDTVAHSIMILDGFQHDICLILLCIMGHRSSSLSIDLLITNAEAWGYVPTAVPLQLDVKLDVFSPTWQLLCWSA